MNTPGLIPHQTITTIVENVTQARADIATAFELLQGAKDRLTAVLGDGASVYYGHLWPQRISDGDLARVAKETDAFQAVNAWRYIINQAGITGYMTLARQEELRKQFDANALPELTVDNVLSTLDGLAAQVGTLATEFVQEVFDWLRPRSPNSVAAQYKTNERWRLGMKVVVPYMVDPLSVGPGFRLSGGYRYSAADQVRSLGNALSLLDGQGIQRYPDDLPTQFDMALKNARSGEKLTLLPYLECRPFHNGNVHLRFLRKDLVEKINKVASDGSLPG